MSKNKTNPYQFENLLINCCVFSIYSDMGPEAVLFYPIPNDTSYFMPNLDIHTSYFTQKNYMQIAVKSISLLLKDYSFEDEIDEKLDEISLFGVLPYPDVDSIALTYFTYFYYEEKNRYLPTTLSLFVKENHRGFIFDNFNRFEKPIKDFTLKLIKLCQKNKITSELKAQKYWKNNIENFTNFFKRIEKIQSKPISPLTKKRRIKILFTGLENTGKTSFLLSIKREFSELPSLLPTIEPMKENLDFLGTTIVKYDIPGRKDLRENVLKKAQRYLLETDVLYYFIDLQNPMIEESVEFLKKIRKIFIKNENKVPIIFILTKYDEDIAKTPKIVKNIINIKQRFLEIIEDHPYKFFKTSIFSIYSIMNAFSYGIRQLSPNRKMLEHLLWEILAHLKMNTGLILNKNGLVLASQDIKERNDKGILDFSTIFEIAAPQFTAISEEFVKYNSVDQNNTFKYVFSDEDFVILKRFVVQDFIFFALFYSKEKNSVKKFEEEFPNFLERITNLLELYIT